METLPVCVLVVALSVKKMNLAAPGHVEKQSATIIVQPVICVQFVFNLCSICEFAFVYVL